MDEVNGLGDHVARPVSVRGMRAGRQLQQTCARHALGNAAYLCQRSVFVIQALHGLMGL